MENSRIKITKLALLAVAERYRCQESDFDDDGEAIFTNEHIMSCGMCHKRRCIESIGIPLLHYDITAEGCLFMVEMLQQGFKDEDLTFLQQIINFSKKTVELKNENQA